MLTHVVILLPAVTSHQGSSGQSLYVITVHAGHAKDLQAFAFSSQHKGPNFSELLSSATPPTYNQLLSITLDTREISAYNTLSQKIV